MVTMRLRELGVAYRYRSSNGYRKMRDTARLISRWAQLDAVFPIRDDLSPASLRIRCRATFATTLCLRAAASEHTALDVTQSKHPNPDDLRNFSLTPIYTHGDQGGRHTLELKDYRWHRKILMRANLDLEELGIGDSAFIARLYALRSSQSSNPRHEA